jgi:hypothetical protein
MSHHFINPQLIAKIQKKTGELCVRWDVPQDEMFQVFQMVATIELGLASLVFYDGDGLTCDGWNGYKGSENSCRNPRSAWGGFYRQEKNQMAGWSVYLIDNAEDKMAQADRCSNAYGYWFIWEDEPRVWGFKGFEDFYTEEERDERADELEDLPHVKKVERHPVSEHSGCYRLETWTTVKKAGLRNEWKERVPR